MPDGFHPPPNLPHPAPSHAPNPGAVPPPHAPTPSPPTPSLPNQALAARLASLDQLVAWGMEVADQARTLIRHAAAPTAQAVHTTPALIHAFDRAARIVRQCIWLQTRLEAAARQAIREAAATESARTFARRTILRQVEDAIARTTPPPRHDALRAELHERLDDPLIDEDIARRELAAIVAELRADLGIPVFAPAPRRPPPEIARLQSRAAAPPSGPARPPLPS